MAERYILIAEDDPDDRFLLQTAFEELDYACELKFVENGVEVLEFLHDQSQTTDPDRFPAFVLLDLNMPRKDGREVLAELKTSAVFQAIPVIIFSTTNNDHEMKRCYELGANSYITKPSSFDKLQHTISALCDYWIQSEQVSEQLEA